VRERLQGRERERGSRWIRAAPRLQRRAILTLKNPYFSKYILYEQVGEHLPFKVNNGKG